MSNSPKDLKYTKTHEWVRVTGDQIEVGITDFAQHQLSDITYVELPDEDQRLEAGDEAVVVESIKAASDVYAPLAGVVVEVNAALSDSPDVINSDPYGDGWLFKMAPDSMDELENLMTSKQYDDLLPKEH